MGNGSLFTLLAFNISGQDTLLDCLSKMSFGGAGLQWPQPAWRCKFRSCCWRCLFSVVFKEAVVFEVVFFKHNLVVFEEVYFDQEVYFDSYRNKSASF